MLLMEMDSHDSSKRYQFQGSKQFICRGRTCLRFSLPAFVLIMILCTIGEILIFFAIKNGVAKIPGEYFVVTPSADANNTFQLKPCTYPPFNVSVPNSYLCPGTPLYCPLNYTCIRHGRRDDMYCTLESSHCQDLICYDHIDEFPFVNNSLTDRYISVNLPSKTFVTATLLLFLELFLILIAGVMLYFFGFTSFTDNIPKSFTFICGFGVPMLVFGLIPGAMFIQTFSPHFQSLATMESAGCFQFDSELKAIILVTLILAFLMCIHTLVAEMLIFGALSFLNKEIRNRFWGFDTFVIVAVFVSVGFSVSCFIIFANALSIGNVHTA